MTSRLVLAPWLIAALLLWPAGCAYNSSDTPIRPYPEREAAVAQRVEKGGVYVTAVRPETGAIRSWRAVEIEAAPGDLLGLREEDGQVFAIVGSRQERLGAMPDGARYVCWATREYRMGVSS